MSMLGSLVGVALGGLLNRRDRACQEQYCVARAKRGHDRRHSYQVVGQPLARTTRAHLASRSARRTPLLTVAV